MIDLSATISALQGKGFTAEQIVVVLSCVRLQVAMAEKSPPKPYRPWKKRYPGQQIHDHPKLREWEKLKFFVFNRDGFICKYCGFVSKNPWKEDNLGPVDITADHVIPLSRGGTNDRENLVCCCIPCNNSKSDRLISEWRGHYGNGKTG